MKYKYKRVDVTTLRGIEEAEKLQRQGWHAISTGFYTIVFEKLVTKQSKR